MEVEIKKHDKMIFLLTLVFLAVAGFIYIPRINNDRSSNIASMLKQEKTGDITENLQIAQSNQEAQSDGQQGVQPDKQDVSNQTVEEPPQQIHAPMENISERVSKKPFGIFITPRNSPISPERFSGYHTAIDLEIFPRENGMEVGVKAACAGSVLMKESASGYGGVVVQSCELDGNPVTVIYGHMKLSSVEKNVGDSLSAGDALGVLGDAYSFETDGERKHLHFGIRKGDKIDILGYVQGKTALSEWIDPCVYLCDK